MGRPCTVCIHNSREEIDTSIIGGSPYRDVAGRFGLSKSAIERHASEHLIAAIARVADISPVTAASLIAELRVLRETTLGVLEEARYGADHSIALKAIARLERQGELIGRLAGELVERQKIDHSGIVFTDQWLRIRAVLMSTLETHPEIRTVLLGELAKLEPAK